MILWTRVRFSSDPPSSTFYPCKSRVGRAFSLLKTVYKNARSSSGIRRAKCSKVGNRSSRGPTKTRNSHSDFDTSYNTERRISTQKRLSIASPKHRREYCTIFPREGCALWCKISYAHIKMRETIDSSLKIC